VTGSCRRRGMFVELIMFDKIHTEQNTVRCGGPCEFVAIVPKKTQPLSANELSNVYKTQTVSDKDNISRSGVGRNYQRDNFGEFFNLIEKKTMIMSETLR